MKPIHDLTKFRPQNRAQLFVLYTILFTATSVVVYLPFLLTNTSLLWNIDGFRQHYEILSHIRHVARQFIADGHYAFWSWNIGLGADSIGSMVSMGYPCFDPFSYIVVLFPENGISAAYTLEIFLQLYTAGVGFLYFGKGTNMSNCRFQRAGLLFNSHGYFCLYHGRSGKGNSASVAACTYFVCYIFINHLALLFLYDSYYGVHISAGSLHSARKENAAKLCTFLGRHHALCIDCRLPFRYYPHTQRLYIDSHSKRWRNRN